MTAPLDVKAIRAALAAAVEAGTGLKCHPRFPGVISPPCAVVIRKATAYDVSMLDVPMSATLGLRLFLHYPTGVASMDLLDDYLSPTGVRSIRAAIEANPTLNGTVQLVQMTEAGEESVVEVQEVQYISTDITIEVG